MEGFSSVSITLGIRIYRNLNSTCVKRVSGKPDSKATKQGRLVLKKNPKGEIPYYYANPLQSVEEPILGKEKKKKKMKAGDFQASQYLQRKFLSNLDPCITEGIAKV